MRAGAAHFHPRAGGDGTGAHGFEALFDVEQGRFSRTIFRSINGGGWNRRYSLSSSDCCRESIGSLPLRSPHAIIFAEDKKIKVFFGDEPIVTLDSPDLQEEMQIKDLLDAGELSSDTLTRLATGIKTEKLEAKDE